MLQRHWGPRRAATRKNRPRFLNFTAKPEPSLRAGARFTKGLTVCLRCTPNTSLRLPRHTHGSASSGPGWRGAATCAGRKRSLFVPPSVSPHLPDALPLLPDRESSCSAGPGSPALCCVSSVSCLSCCKVVQT